MTVLGPGGVSSKQSTIQIRGIHPTYYGRLCPIETPEGQNAGLVNSLTVFARPTFDGHLETPFYTVYKGQVQKTMNPRYTIPYQESDLLLAPADLTVSETFTFPKTRLPLRKNWKFDYGMWNQITTQSVGILQMISVATSLIPFLEHDDANRALMGSNMQRQAVPLIQPEPAYIRTGLESRVISDVQHSLHAETTSYVAAVSARGIRLYSPDQDKKEFFKQSSEFIFPSLFKGFFSNGSNTNKAVLRSNTLKKKAKTHSRDVLKSRKQAYMPSRILAKQLVSEFSVSKKSSVSVASKSSSAYLSSFDLYQRTNQSTCKTHRPTVKEGEWIQKSDILADGAASVGGKIALGKNIIVAYLPWEGYNFEDAILISDRLVKNDIFTSLHIDYYEIEVKNTQYGLEAITPKYLLK